MEFMAFTQCLQTDMLAHIYSLIAQTPAATQPFHCSIKTVSAKAKV